MNISASDMARLSAGELRSLAAAHLDGIHGELTAAGATAREAWSPSVLARKHPVATAVIVAVAAAAGGLIMGRRLRGRRAAKDPAAGSADPAAEGCAASAAPGDPPSFASTLLTSLAGAAGRALPGLLMAVIESQSRKRQ
jgi:hypothetical protein